MNIRQSAQWVVTLVETADGLVWAAVEQLSHPGAPEAIWNGGGTSDSSSLFRGLRTSLEDSICTFLATTIAESSATLTP